MLTFIIGYAAGVLTWPVTKPLVLAAYVWAKAKIAAAKKPG